LGLLFLCLLLSRLPLMSRLVVRGAVRADEHGALDKSTCVSVSNSNIGMRDTSERRSKS
jgi:hypothetical protein